MDFLINAQRAEVLKICKPQHILFNSRIFLQPHDSIVNDFLSTKCDRLCQSTEHHRH
jgi:hypothetical protein